MSAPIPARRPRGIRTMEEMGMSMGGGGDMSGMKAAMERNAKAGSKPMNHGGMEGMKMNGADKKSSHELAEFKASSPMRIGHYYCTVAQDHGREPEEINRGEHVCGCPRRHAL